ncbi:unnamed protein product [Rotaria sp. Silwood1]|nr:unnamed protein product [Rotaria sp. Silwood1]
MAVNPSAPCCYNLEEGSLSTRKIITVTKPPKDSNNNNNKTTTFTDIIQPMIVELIGTIFFILIGLLGSCSDENKNNSLITGLSFGLSLIIFVASLGHISGGHFNPAVTLGVLITGNIQLKKALLYMLMQLIGGVMAAGIFRLLSHTSTYNRCHGGATFLMTIKISKKLDELTMDRINWWEGKNMLTGGSLNPARSLGSAIFANVWSHHYIYWIGPLIGATIAGGFYRY